MRRGFLAALLGITVVGCSAASAAQFDPKNDIHCATLASAMRIISIHQGAPAYQKNAAAFVDDWYGTKLYRLGQSEGREKVLSEAEAIVKLVETDTLSLKDEYVTCADRAIRDAGLDS